MKRRQPGAAPFQMLALCVFFQIFYNVSNGYELGNILVLEFNVKLFFTSHNEIRKLNRVDSQIAGEIGFKGNVIGIQLKFLYKNAFQSFKHEYVLQYVFFS